MNHMPQQMETERRDADIDGMRHLWTEVLTLGLREASGYITGPIAENRSVIEQQAKTWLRSRDFVTVCDLAGFDPDFLRDAYEAGKFTRENWRREVDKW